jgi:hypothetical protein
MVLLKRLGKLENFKAIVIRFAEMHERRLHNHENTEVLQLLVNTNLNRRLKRIKPFELCSA